LKNCSSLSVPNGKKDAAKESKMMPQARRKKYGIFVRIRNI
tara:strand:- start:775 stop:897 length:123 start_codon:yes stop_codon:yes gene_type:complete